LLDLNKILLSSDIIQNDAKLVSFNFFGDLSVPEFTLDELAQLAAQESFIFIPGVI